MTIDERIVELKFDNSQFEQNVKTSMSTLDKLKNALNFNSKKSLEGLQKSVDSVSLDSIASGVDALQARFSTLGIVGMTALSELTRSALNFGKTLYQNTIGQIKSGGMSRALNIEAAKFQLEGLKVAWADVYDDIDYAVSGTAYGLDAAAKAASQLVASGVKFGATFGPTGNSPMAQALRGISGVAAMTNSSYEEIAHIFTTVAGQGKVMTQQLRMLEMRGINAAAILGEQLGYTESEIRDMVTHSEISFKMFSESMNKAFGEHATAANKTFTGSMSNMKAALSRIGELFARPYLENMIPVFNTLRTVFNNIKTELVPFAEVYERIMKGFGEGFERVFGGWRFLRFIQSSLKGIYSIFRALASVVRPIKNAFNDMFNETAFLDFLDISGIKFKMFWENIQLTENASKDLYDGFRGLFSIGKLLANVFNQIARALIPVKDPLNYLAGLMIRIFGVSGRIILFLTEAAEKGNFLTKIVERIKEGLFLLAAIIVEAGMKVKQFIDFFMGLESVQFVMEKVLAAFEKIKEVAGPALKHAAEEFKNMILSFKDFNMGEFLSNALVDADKKVIQFFRTMKQGNGVLTSFKNIFTNENGIGAGIKDFIDSIKFFDMKTAALFSNEGIFGITGFVNNMGAVGEGVGNLAFTMLESMKKLRTSDILFAGVVGSIIAAMLAIRNIAFQMSVVPQAIMGVFKSLRNVLDVAATNIKVRMFQNIAVSLLALAGSLWIVATIPSDKLVSAATAIGILVGAIALLQVALSKIEFGKFKYTGGGANATGFAGIGVAVLALAASLKILENLNPGLALRNVVVLGLLMAELGLVTALMSVISPKMFTGGVSLLLFSGSVALILKALEDVSSINGGDLLNSLKDLTGVIIALGAVAAISKSIGFGAFVGVIGMTLGIKYLSGAMDAMKVVAEKIKEVITSIPPAMYFRLTQLLLVLSGVAVVMGIFGKNIKKTGRTFLAAAVAFSIMVGAVGILAASFKKLNIASIEGAIKVTEALATAIAVLAIVLSVTDLPDIDKRFKAAGSALLKISIAIGIMTYALISLSRYIASFTTGMEALQMLGGALLAFSIIVVGISELLRRADKVEIGKLAGLTTIITMFSVLMLELVALSKLPLGAVFVTAASMAMILWGVGQALQGKGGPATRKIINENYNKTLVQIAAMVAAVAAFKILVEALKELHNVPWLDLLRTAGILVGALAVMGGIFIAIGKFTKSGKNVAAAAAPILAMTAAVYVIAECIKKISTIPSSNDLLNATTALGAMTVIVGGLTILMAYISSKANAANLGVMAGIIGALTVFAIGMSYALQILTTQINENLVGQALGTMALLMLFSFAFTALLQALAKSATAEFGLAILAIGVLAASAVGFAFAMKILGDAMDNLDPGHMAKVAGALMLLGITQGFFGLSGALALIGALGLLAIGRALIIFGKGLEFLANGLNAMGTTTLQDLAKGLGAVAAAALIFGTNVLWMVAAGAGLGVLGLGILALGVALPILCDGLVALNTVGIPEFAASMQQLADSAIIFGQAADQLAAAGVGLIPFAVGLIALGASLFVFGAGLKFLQGAGLDGFAEKMIAVGIAGSILGIVAPAITAAGVALISFGLGLILVGAGLWILERVIEDLEKLAHILLAGVTPGLAIFGQKLVSGLRQVYTWGELEGERGGQRIVDATKRGLGLKNGPNPGAEYAQEVVNSIEEAEPAAEAAGEGFGASLGFGMFEGIQPFINQIGDSITGLFNGTMSLSDAWGNIRGQFTESFAAFSKGNPIVKEFEDIVSNVKADTEELIPNMDELADGIGGVGESAGGAAKDVKTFAESLKETLDGVFSGSKLFEEFKKETDLSKEQLLKNMKSQIQGVAQWSQQLSALGQRGIHQGLLQRLAELGPEGYKYVHAFSQMTVQELEQANLLFAQSLILPGAATQHIYDGFQAAGQNVALGFLNGLDQETIAVTMNALGVTAISEFDKGAGNHSPSVKTRESAINVIKGFVGGLKNYEMLAILAMESMALKIIARARQWLTYQRFYEVGINVSKGLAAGINAAGDEAVAAAENVARRVAEATSKRLEVESPSQVMYRIGRYVDEGFALGMTDNADMVVNSAEYMAEQALNAMRDTINYIYDVVNDNLEAEPVIRPILDLSNLRAGAAQANTLFNNQQQMLGIGQYAGTNGSLAAGATYSFVQNNYSPTALSRLDIYRQTKNQFDALRGWAHA